MSSPLLWWWAGSIQSEPAPGTGSSNEGQRFTPGYRMRVYAPRSTDATEATVLSPAATAWHSDAFQVATMTGVTGYEPVMGWPTGRRGTLNPRTTRIDIGSITVPVLDQRESPDSNANRWLTGFVGDAAGLHQLLGLRVEIDQTLDGGTTWDRWWTGRITSLDLSDNVLVRIEVQEATAELRGQVFLGRPHASLTYAGLTALLPTGLTADYGNVDAVAACAGTIVTEYDNGNPRPPLIVVDASELTPERTLITPGLTSLVPTMTQNPGVTPLPFHDTPVRALVTVTATQATGEFAVGHAVGYRGVNSIYLREVATTDGAYLAMPADGTAVTFTLINAESPPTDDAPLYLDDVHPAAFFRDLCDGYFGRLNAATGAVTRTYPYDATAVSAAAADSTWPVQRFRITKAMKFDDAVEQLLGKPLGFTYRSNAYGSLVPVDLRLPGDLGTLPLLAQADRVGAETLGWRAARKDAVGRIAARTYEDVRQTSEDGTLAVPEGAATAALLYPAEHVTVDYDLGSPDTSEDTLDLDLPGFRYQALEAVGWTPRSIWVREQMRAAIERYRLPYGRGSHTVTVACRRTATVEALNLGDYAVLDFDALPDPDTNTRGGQRVGLCLGIAEDGPVKTLTFLDMGLNLRATAPTLGALAAGAVAAHEVTLTVTLNSASDPVRLAVAATETTQGALPNEDSTEWVPWARVTSSGSVTLRNLPGGKRIWVRGRSEPDTATAWHQPSAWAFPSGADYLDTTTLTAPTEILLTYVDANRAELRVQPGDATLLTEILLGEGATSAAAATSVPVTIAVFPPSDTAFEVDLLDLDAGGPWYRPQARHRDSMGGTSAVVELSGTVFEATGTATVCPDLASLVVLVPA